MLPPIESRIAAELSCKPQQVAAAVALLDEGSTVPFIARYRKEATGGLDDTVENFNAQDGTGTGFKFADYNAGALLEKIREALYFYHNPEILQQMQQKGMAQDN